MNAHTHTHTHTQAPLQQQMHNTKTTQRNSSSIASLNSSQSSPPFLTFNSSQHCLIHPRDPNSSQRARTPAASACPPTVDHIPRPKLHGYVAIDINVAAEPVTWRISLHHFLLVD